MKKIIAILLLLCMVLPLASCKKDKEDDDAEQTSGSGGNLEVSTETDYLETLPKKDLKGADFRILVATQLEGFYNQKNASADIVDNACYKRNNNIEKLFNTKLVYNALDGNASGATAFATEISTSVMAGEEGYNIIIGQNYYCLPLVTSNTFYNLKNATVINWNADWYHQSINSNGEINGKLYGGSGSFVISQLAYAMGLFYNKDIYKDYGFADKYDVYQLVRDGNWTWDIFYEMVTTFDASVTDDVLNSTYGFVKFDHAAAGLSVGLGVDFVTKNGKGEWTVDNFYNDKTEDIYEKLRALLNDHPAVSTSSALEDLGAARESLMGNFLFCMTYIHGRVEDSMFMQSDGITLGVLPAPKLEAGTATQYRTRIMRNELFYIPVNSDLETSALVLEALNYETQRVVYPEYQSKVLEIRSSDTSEDMEMMQLIASTVHSDFANYYSQDLNSMDWSIASSALKGDKSLSTWWGKNGKSLGKLLNKVIENYGSSN